MLPPLAPDAHKPSKPYSEDLPGAVAHAYPKAQPTNTISRAWKIWLVCGDCFLIGLAPVLVHMSKDADGKYGYNPITVNLMVEVVKTLFALGTLIAYGTGRPGVPMTRSLRSFARDASHNRLLAVPALLYAVNNYLKFVMQLYFKPTTAKMLGNSKILVIAVLMRSVLRRSFTLFQWEALYLLVAGITVNQLHTCGGGTGAGALDSITPAAVAFTAASITVPSLASVYNEAALKRHMDTSVLLQNFFLYFYGACFNVVGLVVVAALQGAGAASLWSGFGMVTSLLVLNNALQGILSSFFFKFADTILKKYSSTIATIFTGVMSAALFGHALTLNFCLGVSIVFISMHIFFSTGPGKATGKPVPNAAKLTVFPSMDHLALRTPESRGTEAGLIPDLQPTRSRPQRSDSLLPR